MGTSSEKVWYGLALEITIGALTCWPLASSTPVTARSWIWIRATGARVKKAPPSSSNLVAMVLVSSPPPPRM